MSDTPRTDAEIEAQFQLVKEDSRRLTGIIRWARYLEMQNATLQAKIDSLMLEFCPNEMTEEQMGNWEKCQRKARQ